MTKDYFGKRLYNAEVYKGYGKINVSNSVKQKYSSVNGERILISLKMPKIEIFDFFFSFLCAELVLTL